MRNSILHVNTPGPSGLGMVHAIYLCPFLSCGFATRPFFRNLLEGVKLKLLISKSRGTLDPTPLNALLRVKISTSRKAEHFWQICRIFKPHVEAAQGCFAFFTYVSPQRPRPRLIRPLRCSSAQHILRNICVFVLHKSACRTLFFTLICLAVKGEKANTRDKQVAGVVIE